MGKSLFGLLRWRGPFGGGLGRWPLDDGPPPPVVLGDLTLSGLTIAENAAENTVVGSIIGRKTGSSLSLTDTAGGRFKLVGTDILRGATALDYETSTTHNITITETLGGATGSPKPTVIAIGVIDVDEVAPVITGPTGAAGAASITVNVLDSQTLVGSFTFSKPTTLGAFTGADAAFFQWQNVTPTSADLRFISLQSKDTPSDANADGTYLVTVTAANAAGYSSTMSVSAALNAAPRLLFMSPAPGSTNVARTTSPVLTFSEPIFPGSSLSASIWKSTGGWAPVFTWNTQGSSPGQMQFSGSTLTLHVPSELPASSQVYIYVAGTTVVDSLGVPYAGMLEEDLGFVTAAVAAPAAPVNSAPPVASGSTVVGQTASTTNGTWTGTVTGYAYQWYDANTGNPIPGATANTLLFTKSHIGMVPKPGVKAINAGTASIEAMANALDPVTDVPNLRAAVIDNVTYDDAGRILSFTVDEDGTVLLATHADPLQPPTALQIQNAADNAVYAGGIYEGFKHPTSENPKQVNTTSLTPGGTRGLSFTVRDSDGNLSVVQTVPITVPTVVDIVPVGSTLAISSTSTTATYNSTSSHTFGSGTNKVAVVVVNGIADVAGAPATVTVTLGATEMTSILAPYSGGAGREWVGFWALPNPAAGSTALSVVTSGNQRGLSARIIEATGVDQATPSLGGANAAGNGGSASTAATVSRSATAGSMLITSVSVEGGSIAAEFAVSGGSTLIGTNQTGTAATSDVSSASSYEAVTTTGAEGNGFTWITGRRASIGMIELKRAT